MTTNTLDDLRLLRPRVGRDSLFEPVPKDAAVRLILEGYSENSDVGDYGSLTWTFTWK